MGISVEFYEGQPLADQMDIATNKQKLGPVIRRQLPVNEGLRKALLEYTERALDTLRAELPSGIGDYIVTLAENPSLTSASQYAVGGRLTDSGISLGFNLHHPDLKHLGHSPELPYLIAHEGHHLARMLHHGMKVTTVTDHVVNEGLAVEFSRYATLKYHSQLPLVARNDYCSDDQIHTYIDAFMDLAELPGEASWRDHRAEPVLCNAYRLGRYIVRKYMDREGVENPMSIVGIPSRVIIAAVAVPSGV